MKLLKPVLWAIAIFLALAVLGSALFLPVLKQTEAIDRQVIASREEAVRGAVSGVRIFIQELKAEGEGLARSVEPWRGGSSRDTSEARQKLDAALRMSTLFDQGSYVTTPQGLVTASSSGMAALVSLRRPSGLLEAAQQSTAVSGVYQDPLLKTPSIAVARGLRDSSGQVTAILVAVTSVANPRVQELASLPFPRAVRAFVIDPEGQGLAPSRPDGIDRSNRSLAFLHQRATAAPTGSATFRGPGGVVVLGAWAIASDGWSVGAYQEKNDLLEATQAPVRSAGVALGVMILIASILTFLLLLTIRSAKEEAERVKRAFLAIAGHELRTPLTSIRGFSQTMERRWDKLSDEQGKEMVSTIARQARNLENLVERLLIGAQLEAGITQSPSIRETDVAEAIEKAVEHQQPQAPLHTFQIDATSPLIGKADPKGLNQILTQLLENAVKYSPSGGTVYVGARKVRSSIEITVEDEGVGLPSDISGIFEKFGQAEAVDTRVYDEGGVGLGLFIAKKHVEMMDGTIEAKRRDPTGARFVVRIPS